VYVANYLGSSISVIRDFGGGMEETPNAEVRAPNRGATIIRGSLSLPRMPIDQFPVTLLDISGRKLMDLHPGANDVRHLAPGVYFVREPSAATKVIVAR
jgi:hypothetical protein